MATKTKPRRRVKAKQPFLDGMEPERIPALDNAAEAYYDVMMERTELKTKEKEAQSAIDELMIEKQIMTYTTIDGITLTRTQKSKVTAKKKKAETNGDGEE